jgi:hypothetical protein
MLLLLLERKSVNHFSAHTKEAAVVRGTQGTGHGIAFQISAA